MQELVRRAGREGKIGTERERLELHLYLMAEIAEHQDVDAVPAAGLP